MAGTIGQTVLPRGIINVLVFRALASGSSGNAYLLRTRKAAILLEVGLRISKLREALLSEGIEPSMLTAALVSHEHTDHCIGAADLARMHNVPICANAEVLRAAGLRDLSQASVLSVGRPTLVGDVEITLFPVSHDAVRPVGFFARAGDRTIAIATDLGRPTPEMTEAVSHADLVVLEANHDLGMLHEGRYPLYLRRRVASATGHLSNDQAAGVLMDHVKNDNAQVWLAHLSKENNSPRLAVQTVRRCLAVCGLSSLNISVARRDNPSARWTGEIRPRQLSLFPTGALA